MTRAIRHRQTDNLYSNRKAWTIRRPNQPAFTFVETLVVTLVVAIAIALTLPAIQFARESARRTQCQSNLRQLGVGLAGYEAALRHLPAGRDARHGWHHSWITHLLPFLEPASLHDGYDFRRAWDDQANEPVTSSRMPLAQCPTAHTDGPGKSDYGDAADHSGGRSRSTKHTTKHKRNTTVHCRKSARRTANSPRAATR